MDYIHNKCTIQAFTVIQPHISPKAEYPYENHKQVLANLEENFGTHDKLAQAKADMQSPTFPIRSKDKNKSFDAFHSRFAATIAPLRYSDNHKIRDLKRYIMPELRDKITNGSRAGSYKEYITQLHTCDLEMKQNSALNTQAKATQSIRGNGGRGGQNNNSRRGGRGRGRGGSSSTPRSDRQMWPPYVLAQIQKKKLYIKCLKPNHFAKDSNAPCKGNRQLTNKEVETRLASISIDYKVKDKGEGRTAGTDSEN